MISNMRRFASRRKARSHIVRSTEDGRSRYEPIWPEVLRGEPQRLPWPLLGHPLRRQVAQLLVDQRQQPAGPVRIALTQGAQELGHVFHHPEMISAPGRSRQQVATREEHGDMGAVMELTSPAGRQADLGL